MNYIILFSLLQYQPWDRACLLLVFLYLPEAPSGPQHPDIEKYYIIKPNIMVIIITLKIKI